MPRRASLNRPKRGHSPVLPQDFALGFDYRHFDCPAGIRDKPIIETNAADLLVALRSGTRCTNHYLRRLHNLALGLGWLNWPLLAPKMWPKTEWRRKRGITEEEHQLVTLNECNGQAI